MLIVAYLLKYVSNLTNTGYSIKDLIGKTGTVYHEISSEKGGKVQISIDENVTKEIDAISYDKSKIEPFNTVKVVKVLNDSLVSVRKV